MVERLRTFGKGMMVAAFMAWVLFVVTVFSGCATLSLPDDASVIEKRAAYCYDAQTAYELSVSMLDGAIGGTERIYWEAYKLGASIALHRYCPVIPAPPQ